MAVLAEPETSSAVVLEAQKLLNKSTRQSRAPENGAFDKATLAAIKQFQIESGLKPTGVLDDKVMDYLRKTASAPDYDYQITVNGKTYLLTKADHKALINRMKQEFRPAVQTLASAVAEGRGYYNHMKELNKDQYIVSWCIEAVKRTSLPSESLFKTAERGLDATEKALSSGDFKAFAVVFPKAQADANKARAAIKTYVADMISGGEGIETGLQIVSTSSFIVVGILAVPVAASFGAGAVLSGVIAGAGTAAVESLAHEVGKGISGSSKGFEDAGLNVLRDAFIGGSIGAVFKGTGGEKIIAKIAPMITKKLGGTLFEKASEKVVIKWLTAYLKKNGLSILEGIAQETISTVKKNPTSLTTEKFFSIVAAEVAKGAIFGKFGKAGDVSASSVLKKVGMKQRIAWLEQMGKGAKPGDVEKLFGQVFTKTYDSWGGKVFDTVLGNLNGTEEPDAVEKKIIDEAAVNAALIAAMDAAVKKKGK